MATQKKFFFHQQHHLPRVISSRSRGTKAPKMAEREAGIQAALIKLTNAIGEINISQTAAKHKIPRKMLSNRWHKFQNDVKPDRRHNAALSAAQEKHLVL